ncbi:DUF2269 family protein [Saccharomonospora cyanea]|uniref:Putative integral membrane protein (DUF2269) n=1 Tax=Saccharomonospora cyanea NA-134 TaxID=882082 RepID=H5XDQ8_9PSEU|nr:hypothetical protein [Saccharomonospora cyanea]EHR61379.1 putative integral membrane protein (DUF2269) [Saccharomonospora cyanea NA-134]
MTKLFLSLHVLAAIIAVGPVTVAASMFPATLRRALGDADAGDARTTLRTLHRICRVYAGVGIAVPLFGFATASSLGVLGDAWLITSILLTAAAVGVLALLILPAQDRALAEVTGPPTPSAPLRPGRLAMFTGVFNLLWATVTVLMIVRPGSTTGV